MNIKVFYLDDTFNYQTTFWAYATVNASCRTEKKKCFSSRLKKCFSRPFFFSRKIQHRSIKLNRSWRHQRAVLMRCGRNSASKSFFFTIFIYRTLLIGYAACISECFFLIPANLLNTRKNETNKVKGLPLFYRTLLMPSTNAFFWKHYDSLTKLSLISMHNCIFCAWF